MKSSEFPQVVAIIAACGGVGGFIDFMIGKKGHDKVELLLIAWFYKFDEVKFRTFGRQEAMFAVVLLDRFFGRNFFSRRRLSAAIIASLIATLWWSSLFVIPAIINKRILDYQHAPEAVPAIFYSAAWFAFSISVTRYLTFKTATVLAWSPNLNIVAISLLCLIQYIFGILMPQFAAVTFINLGASGVHILSSLFRTAYDLATFNYSWKMIGPHAFWEQVRGFFSEPELVQVFWYSGPNMMGPPRVTYMANWSFAAGFICATSSLIRLLIFGLFAASYLVWPLHQTIHTIWCRLVESDKPIFALIFGGIATLAEVIHRAMAALN